MQTPVIPIKILLIVFLAIQVFLSQGCAPPVVLKADKFSTIKEIKVAHYKTPDMKVFSTGRMIAGALSVVGPLAAGIYVALGSEDKYALDFCSLVQKDFMEYAKKNVANWPTTEIVEYPITEDFKDYRDTLITIKIFDHYQLQAMAGLATCIAFTMEDRDHNIIWRKYIMYRSVDFKHERTERLRKLANKKDQFTSEDIALIIAEMDYAAKVTAAGAIKDLTAGKVIINVNYEGPERFLKQASEKESVTK